MEPSSSGLPAITCEWANIWPLWPSCSLHRSPQSTAERALGCHGGVRGARLKSRSAGACVQVYLFVYMCRRGGGGRWGALNEAINKIIFYPAKEITAWHSTTNSSTQLPSFPHQSFQLKEDPHHCPRWPTNRQGERARRWCSMLPLEGSVYLQPKHWTEQSKNTKQPASVNTTNKSQEEQ